MDEIATEAGVARSTLYVYFANREELLRACLQRMHTLLLDSVVASWERDSAPVRRLRTLVLAMLERIDDNPAFFRLALATQGAQSEVATTVGAELALIGLDVAGLIQDVIEQGTLSGDFRLLDPEKATTFVGQQLYGAMSVRAGEVQPAPLARGGRRPVHVLAPRPGRSDRGHHRDRAHRLSFARPRRRRAMSGGRRALSGQRTMVGMGRRSARKGRGADSPRRATGRVTSRSSPFPSTSPPWPVSTCGCGAAPPNAGPRRVTTNDATPSPAWPWAWRASWHRWWRPSCWLRSHPVADGTARP